jgi:predicted nucleic acid-binding Zn finger protein
MSNETRESKGRDIADNAGVCVDGDGYSVGRDRTYYVDGDRAECDCADFKYRGGRCKHIEAVDYALDTDQVVYADCDECSDLPF